MRRKFVWMFSLCTVILGSGLFLLFNGNPFTKYESQKIALKYLDSKFPDASFTVENTSYYPFEGTYIVSAISKDGTIEMTIDVRNGKVIKDGQLLEQEKGQ